MIESLPAILIGSLLGATVAAILVSRAAERKIRTMRHHERRTTWLDCIRFHQFPQD